MSDFLSDLLQLSETKVTGYELTDYNEIFINVESTSDDIPCRECGKLTKFKGLGEEREIRHLPLNGRACYLIIKPKRGICNDCDNNPTTHQRLDWYEYKSSYTKAYTEHLMLSLVNSTMEDVAIKENVSAETIRRLLNKTISESVNWKNFKRLGIIGIDEIAVKKGYKDYRTIITCRYKRDIRIIGVLANKEKETVKQFLESIPNRLQRTIDCVCTDMYDGFVNASKEALPKTMVVVDRFHVAKAYRECLTKVRKKEVARLKKKLPEDKYKNLKESIDIVRHNKEIANLEERKKVEVLFKLSPKLRQSYRLCRKLTAIYNSHIKMKTASKKIDEWIALVQAENILEFKTFIATLSKYKEEIIGYFKGRNNSGFVEGFNNKIKVMKRRCYGIFNEKSLFRRIFLDTEGYSLFKTPCGFKQCNA